MPTIEGRAIIVGRFAADPDFWADPVNRALSRMAAALLEAGVDTDVLYEALLAGSEGR